MASYEMRTWWSRYQLTERLANEAFLEAAITGAFLIAAADGNASEQEHDALLDRLEILGGVDRDRIDEPFTAAAKELEASGFEPCIARVGELITDRAAAEAAMMLALAVALADDVVSDEEQKIAGQLAEAIGLTKQDLEPLLIQLRS